MNYESKKNKRKQQFLEMGFFEWLIVFFISTGAIAIERFTAVSINNSYVRLLFYTTSASLLTFWLGWIFFGFRAVRNRIFIFAIVLGICLLKDFLTWGGDWKTQTILYTSRQKESSTIEFQMRGDWYAFGYKKRIVERKKIIPFFDYITDIDTAKLDKSFWKRVDTKVNQLKLKNFNDMPSN